MIQPLRTADSAFYHISQPAKELRLEGYLTACLLTNNELMKLHPLGSGSWGIRPYIFSKTSCPKCMRKIEGMPEPDKMVFVFGSNLAGRHGRGAALYALKNKGAIYGVGVGMQGGAYAIPTKTGELKKILLDGIRGHVNRFLNYARANSQVHFQVTRIGCGLAGYNDYQIAPMFSQATSNVHLPSGWRMCANEGCNHLGLQHSTLEGELVWDGAVFCTVKKCNCDDFTPLVRLF